MKVAFVFAALCGVFLLTSCADQSLLTDEEYRELKGPAPHSPDYSSVAPTSASRAMGH
jgi:hypothetical protein